MKTKNILCGLAIAVVLHLGVLAGSAQTNIYLFSGAETNITLNPDTYIITAYGAKGGSGHSGISFGGVGDWVSAEFNFSTSTNLTLLVGGPGGDGEGVRAGGDGGGSFVVAGSTPLVVAGGGGGAAAHSLNTTGAMVATTAPTAARAAVVVMPAATALAALAVAAVAAASA
jgi:hypothetical protein